MISVRTCPYATNFPNGNGKSKRLGEPLFDWKINPKTDLNRVRNRGRSDIYYIIHPRVSTLIIAGK